MVQIHPDPPEFRWSPDPRNLHIKICGVAAIEQPTKFWNSDQAFEDRLACAKRIGAIAQMGERLICIQEVGGSIPPGSTIVERGKGCLFNTKIFNVMLVLLIDAKCAI